MEHLSLQSEKRKNIIAKAASKTALPPIVRTLSFVVTSEQDHMKAETILGLHGFSVQNAKNLRKYPGLLLCNHEVIYITDRLRAGDYLTVHIVEENDSETILPTPMPLDIIYEDSDILIVNKPAGIPTHPSINHHTNTLANAVAHYYQQKGRRFVFRVITRLDKDTSGLVLIAKHYFSAARLGDSLKQGHATGIGLIREYIAICEGELDQTSGTISAPIGRVAGSVIERRVDFCSGDSAITHFTCLERANGLSLVKLQLETGRTHQIRIHMRHMGFPLVGDQLYNPASHRMDRQALHSYHLSFPHPITQAPMEFYAPLPEDMKKLFTFE